MEGSYKESAGSAERVFLEKRIVDGLIAISNDLDNVIPRLGLVLLVEHGAEKTKRKFAELFSIVLHSQATLSNDHFIETTPIQLIGQDIESTRVKSRAVYDSAKGGVLFINDVSGFDGYGLEALNTLIEFMTETEDMDTLVILSGYPEVIREFFNKYPTIRKHFAILPDDYPIPETKIENNDSLKVDDIHSLEDKESDNLMKAPVDLFPKEDEPHKEIVEEINEHINNIEESFTGQIDSLKESVSGIQEIIENVQFNVAMLVQKQASSADIAVLQRENEAFRSDSNMKLMRRYGIDAMIKTYQAICDKLFRLKHPHSESKNVDTEINTLGWVLKRIERQFKPLGIKLKSSQPGTSIDESVMVVYGSDGEDVEDSETIIETDDVNLKDTVKESVCPAFVWTIPSLIGDAKEWYMEVEKVCIYK